MDSTFPISASAQRAEPDTVLFQLLAVAILVALNAFFVAFEFAVVKVRASQLDAESLPGRRRARAAREILRHMEAYLSAAQLGITLTSLGLGWSGEPFVARLLAPVLGSLGVSRPDLLAALSFALAFGIITFLHIVVGEQAPKILAIRRARQILLLCAWPMRFFYAIFRPFIHVINFSSGWLLRVVFRLKPASGHETVHTAEELRSILETGVEGEDAPVSELGREILINALDMRKRVVRDIMTPRGEVVFLDLDESFDANLGTAMTSRHTRFPLCRGHLDKAVGLIHIKDLIAMVHEERSDLMSIKRELVHVPELMPLERLLKVFLGKGAHLALAVDEYGGAVGIVTLDNVLAELVGEIQDEFDSDEAEYRKVGEGEFLLDGGMALHELGDLLGIKVESAEVSTIGGYITHELGHLPAKGENIVFDGYEFTVRQADDRRVLSVHAKLLPDSAEDAGDRKDA
ncbi:MAG: HlyC/CorC family transporter [Chthoniobacterales bacterium]|nr:HlyC/CorC family transporter [Chthoniobacterales bacterium]